MFHTMLYGSSERERHVYQSQPLHDVFIPARPSFTLLWPIVIMPVHLYLLPTIPN
jgi:hypothetical protein